jgi:hypothetical protein
MTHLSPAQIVDVAEGSADAACTAHLAACGACRSKVDAIADAIRVAGVDPRPEPSPLFWPHLAARIGDAVRRDRVLAPAWQRWGARWAPLGAAAVLLTAVVVGVRMWPGTPAGGRTAPPGPAAELAADSAADSPATDGEADDPSWVLVSELSADVSVEDAEASGVFPPPGGAEKALLQLDDAERFELARILREELALRLPLDPQDSED